jgi:hypothetical protein
MNRTLKYYEQIVFRKIGEKVPRYHTYIQEVGLQDLTKGSTETGQEVYKGKKQKIYETKTAVRQIVVDTKQKDLTVAQNTKTYFAAPVPDKPKGWCKLPFEIQ